VAALPSISFITAQQTIKHVGVLLGYDMQAASHQQFTGVYHASIQRPSEQLLEQLSQKLRKLVASAQQASHSDDAVPLAQECFLPLFFFFLGYRGIVHPPSDDEGTERIWFEHEQRPRKRVPKRSVYGKQTVHSMPAGANKDTRQT